MNMHTVSNTSAAASPAITLRPLPTLQARAGEYASVLKGSVMSTLLDAGLLFLLRFALDDGVEGVMSAAVHALRALLVCAEDEVSRPAVLNDRSPEQAAVTCWVNRAQLPPPSLRWFVLSGVPGLHLLVVPRPGLLPSAAVRSGGGR